MNRASDLYPGLAAEAARQQAIVAALFAADRQEALAAASGAGVSDRAGALAVGLGAYRGNGVAVAERALQTAYPATFELLGESAATAAAHLWRRVPPRSGDLADWGAGFAEWLEAQPSLADWPQLAGCARIEWACHCTARAADAAMDVGSLALLGTHTAEALRLRLKPDVARVSVTEGSYQLWRDASGKQASAEPAAAPSLLQDARSAGISGEQPMSGREVLIVWRDGFAPRVEPLVPRWAVWLDRVAAGASLQDLSTHLPEADLETALASLISRGWLLSIVNSPHIVDTEEPA